MKPEPVPDEHLWPGSSVVAFKPPEGVSLQHLLEILPVTGVADRVESDAGSVDRIHFRIGVDDVDLDLIRKRGWFWLVFYGGVVPFAVEHPEVDDWFQPPDEEEE